MISSWNINAQDNFYDINTIQQIEISFYQSNWDYIMDTAKAGSGSYLMAQWVKINGVQFDSAGVKYKGSSSYDPAFDKNPLHISLDEFKNQSYQGFSSIKLANFYGDPSMIREPLAYSILSNYMDCSRSNFATVSINGNFIGLYSNDESVNKKFCSAHFYSSGNTFIKGSPILPGPYSKSDLKYISADSSDYFGKYEIESDYGWNDLVDLCYMLKYDIASIEENIDIDRALWMLAFNNVLVNLDSYSGWFAQNHYLYKDNTGHYNPVVWDLNMAFGGFPFSGTQNGGSGSLTVEQMQQMNPLLHADHNDWPMIFVLMSNPLWRRMYIAHMRTIIEENFANSDYFETASEMMVMISNSVQLDQNKFFTDEQFFESLTTDITFGSYVIPGIQNLMDARAEYLLATDIFSDAPPLITNVISNVQEPILGEQVTINATVAGQGQLNVFLGVRHDKEEKFARQVMYDDGNHNDGAPGDGIYGASFTMSSLIAHYYIYAEVGGADVFAATFSPERAEHEFYTLQADIPVAGPGDAVINEFLAKNTSDTTNEYGNYEDWIEIYNLTDEPVDLFGLYLTDDFSNPGKFAFPENSIVQPGDYLMLWADEEDTVSAVLHANFKLSADGESLMLSDGAGLVLDSLTFGPQTADVSFGRCPVGYGPFSDLEFPTFGEDNYCPDFISDKRITGQQFVVMPNPFRDNFTVVTDAQGAFTAEVYSFSGIMIAENRIESGLARFNSFDLPAGLYFVLLRNDKNKVLGSRKIMKL
jgi:spore coat protein CotH